MSALRTQLLTVLVPFTDLRTETYQAVIAAAPRAEFVWTGAHPEHYWQLLTLHWGKGRGFALVEHDVVPPAGWLEAFDACTNEWCAVPYPIRSFPGQTNAPLFTALGCTRFAGSLLAKYPRLIEDIPIPHRRWTNLDGTLVAALNRLGEQVHEHLPPARHLQRPFVGRRKTLASLTYVGDGTRYLDGVPAADFETDDPVLLAIALESGLYTEVAPAAAEAAPKKGKTPAPEAAAPVDSSEAAADNS